MLDYQKSGFITRHGPEQATKNEDDFNTNVANIISLLSQENVRSG